MLLFLHVHIIVVMDMLSLQRSKSIKCAMPTNIRPRPLGAGDYHMLPAAQSLLHVKAEVLEIR